MTKLIWGTIGERFYEAGADRGVLYLNNGISVPWNGLISVKEASDGGDPTPYYFDGFKYLNLSSSEEFKATIEAFSSPSEFTLCDGAVAVGNGLFITQQPRKAFGLSYRTKIGNDIDGLTYGYKLHLVYNALAAPSSRDNNTITDSLDPNTLSWEITTSPPPLSLFKPSAHLIIDSTKTLSSLMITLEDLIYGSTDTEPTLPTPDELIILFTGV